MVLSTSILALKLSRLIDPLACGHSPMPRFSMVTWPLLGRHGLCQIARLIHVGTLEHGHMVGNYGDRNYGDSLLNTTRPGMLPPWRAYLASLSPEFPTTLPNGETGAVESSTTTTRFTSICLAQRLARPGRKSGATASCPTMSTSSPCCATRTAYATPSLAHTAAILLHQRRLESDWAFLTAFGILTGCCLKPMTKQASSSFSKLSP